MGWIQFHAKRYDDAAASYKELIEKFDASQTAQEARQVLREARLVLSNIYVIKKDIPQAEEWLEQVLDEFPEDAGAMNDLGYLWADQGKNLPRALEMARFAVEADPDNHAYHDSLGWALYKLGRYAEALEWLKKAASGEDPDGVILDHLGDCHLQARPEAGSAGRLAQAHWKRSIEKENADRDRSDEEEDRTEQVMSNLKSETSNRSMAGHSHWANIAHKKSLIDAKRGKVWSKLAKAIIVAAKGGGDPDTNLSLRYAIDAAKAVSMPKDNIERAIKKGTGELEGGNLEAALYEGYGPGGVAVLCEILTDNRNRTAPEIRKIFEMHDGKLGATGCVAWMFERKGLFLVPADSAEEESADGAGPGGRRRRREARGGQLRDHLRPGRVPASERCAGRAADQDGDGRDHPHSRPTPSTWTPRPAARCSS